MLTEIDLTKKPVKPKLYLCKPNKQSIAILSEAYNIKHNTKFSSVNELSFTIPVNLELDHQFQKNPHIDMIKDRYLIKLMKDQVIEYYIIDKIIDSSDDSSDTKQISCFSLQYELADKLIRSYEVVSYNAQQVLIDALSQTLWSIDYIDPIFLSTYRSFNVSSKTVLSFVVEIAETFSALITYNTILRTISLYNPDNIGINKDLRFSYGNLIKTIEQTISMDNFATRLKIYGENNLTIANYNPTGTDYLENMSNFMNLDYMSQGLINAIVAYEELIVANTDTYSTLLSQLTVQQELLTTKSNEIDALDIQLTIILDSLDIAQSTSQPTATLISQRNAKQLEIDAKQLEIDAVNAQIVIINGQITALQTTLSIENNFTPEQIQERNLFIIEKEATNNNYTNAQDLYNYGVKEFEKICKPEISIKLDIVNFLEVLEMQHMWDKLVLGDFCTVYYPLLNINIKARITIIDFDFESGSIALTIANVEEILTDEQKFLNNLYNTISTSNTVNMDKYKIWNGVDQNTSEISTIIDQLQGKISKEITLSCNENVEISRRGIIVTSPTSPLDMLIITNGVLAISNDQGNTWGHAITKDGIVGDRIFGRILAGVNCEIDTGDGNFLVNENGVTISGTSLTITNGLPESQINQTSTSNWNSAQQNAIDLAQLYADNTFVDKTTHTADYAYLEGLIDGSISTWFYDYIPSLINLPASDWTTDELKNNHLGDVFYDNTTGSAYRFALISSVYQWTPITDSAVTEALQKANDAQDTADGKRRVFVVEPTVPYDVGDLWSGGISGDLKVCKTPKLSTEVYSIDDWENASKYTDDTSLTTFVDDIYTVDKNDLLTQIDGKIESYFTSTDPNTWIEADRLKHNGDMWYNASTKLLKRYNGTTNAWELIEDQKAIDAYTNAQTAQTTADGKRTVFVSQPTTPYKVGDLWDDGTSSNLKICKVEQLTGDFDASDWSYTTVSQQISDLANDSKLTPSEKLLIKKEWEVIKLEKPKLDAQSSLYTLPIDTSVNIQFTQWLNGTIKKVEPFWDYNLDGIYNTSDNFSWASATALIIYDKAYDWLNRYITNYLLLDNGLTTNLPSDFAPIITPPGQTASELNTQGEVFRKSFADYYWAKANLIGAITNNINSTLADIASDSKLSPSEKQVIKKEWDIIASEKLIFDTQSTTYGISVSTEKTNYNDAYVALDNYLNSPIGSALLTSLTTTSTIVGTDFRLIFKDYYDKKTLLSNKLSDVIKTTADNSIQSGTNYNKCFIDLNGIQVQNATETEVVKMGEFATGLYGLRASHSDGSYTQLTANGLERFISIEGVDTSKPYQYETYVQTASTIGSGVDFVDHDWSDATKAAAHAVWTNGILVDLPTRFRNKDFQCFLSITKMKLILGVPTAYSDMNLEIISIDKSLARLQISGYNLVYESFEGYYYQGIEFLITTIL